MGPNGSGKSTLANTLMGNPDYEVTEGTILLNGEDLTEADPDERARAGLFLAFQYPATIPGVSIANFLRMAVNARREEPIKVKEFGALLKENVDLLEDRPRFHQALPQRGLLRWREEACRDPPAGDAQPEFAMLDETDSGPRHRRPADRVRGCQRPARPTSPAAHHHPLHAASSTTCAPTSSTSCSTAASSRRAAPSSPTSSRTRAMTGSARRSPGECRLAGLRGEPRGRTRGLRERGAPNWRRSGFWTTSLRKLDLDALEPRRYEPAAAASRRRRETASLGALIVQRGASTVPPRSRRAAQGDVCPSRRPSRSTRSSSASTRSALPFDEDKFPAGTAAFWTGGVFVHVPAGGRVERPIQSI